MIKFNFLKKLKLSEKRLKVFIITLLVIIYSIPFLVFAIDNITEIRTGRTQTKNNGLDYKPIYWNETNDGNNVIPSQFGVCVRNSSNQDYFIPTRTLSEWNSFKTGILKNPELGLSIIDLNSNSNSSCIGDGVCNTTQITNSYGVSVPVENYLTAPSDCADNFNCGVDTLTDPRDGKTYNTTDINGRCWMAQNLNYGCSDAGGDCGGRGNHYTYAEALNGDTPADKAKGIYHKTSTPATHD